MYLYRNRINGKLYIGQTSNIAKRCTQGNYKSCKYFYSAIQKYGWDNFDQIILKENLCQEEADYWECFFIHFFDTTNHIYGYNLSDGGNKKCILTGENNGFYGKTHNQDTLYKMIEKKTGGNNPNAKAVLCITTGVVFPSAREASEWCGASRQHINRVCRGERKHTGKHPQTGEMLEWRYYNDKD